MSKTCFRSAGHWQFERSSGFAGYRCQHCATWVYEDQAQICQCDGYKGAGQLSNTNKLTSTGIAKTLGFPQFRQSG